METELEPEDILIVEISLVKDTKQNQEKGEAILFGFICGMLTFAWIIWVVIPLVSFIYSGLRVLLGFG